MKELMKVLLNFGFVDECSEIHGMVEKIMRAEFVCLNLLSVEQMELLEKNLEIEENFMDLFNKKKKEDVFTKTIAEWQDAKFFKH